MSIFNFDYPHEYIDHAFAMSPRKGRLSRSIGASAVGNSCTAALSFTLRGFPDVPPDPMLERIFGLGHKIEDMVVADLKRVPHFVISEKDSATGGQYRWQAYAGHTSGYADGLICMDGADNFMLLEIKSMNDGTWSEFKRHGIAVSHPHYMDQMTWLMGMSGFRKCLMLAYNKNNSRYWSEVVDFDDFRHAALKAKIESVFRGEGRKVANDPADWRCKGCFKREVCWHGIVPDATCKNCKHSIPDTAHGGWFCTKFAHSCDEPCSHHELWRPLDRDE